MKNALRRLRDGRVVIMAAAAWAIFDALVHVIVDMVEPPRIAGNLSVVVAGALALVGVHFGGRYRLAAVLSGIAFGLVLGFNLAWVISDGGADEDFGAAWAVPLAAAIFITVALVLTAWAAWRFLVEARNTSDADSPSFPWSTAAITAVLSVVAVVASLLAAVTESTINQLHSDELEAADYWSDELEILSAGFGFDNIVGTPDDGFETTRGSGGAWLKEPDCVSEDGPLTSAVLSGFISRLSRGEATFDDGLPIVTTWPVLPSTMNPEDFLFTLNTGEQVVPHAATMVPNWELNERTTMVVFGDFGNRAREDDPGLVLPVKLEIVDDGSPLMFVGPGGVAESGVGLAWETDSSPYFEGATGPFLVGAKLNRIGDEPEGEGGVGALEQLALPNDEFALYGGGDFKVRILTTGGFSPDGLTGVTPDQYEDFFRLHATGPDGETVLMTEVGVDYELQGGTLRVVGLSDLGKAEGGDVHYDDCYFEDVDNYIDIILEGDEEAARGLTILEIPADTDDDYLSFYNPGGPGPEPFPEVRYNQPGPQDLEPIIIALDDPMRVSYP